MMLSHNVATQMAKSRRQTSNVLQLLEKHFILSKWSEFTCTDKLDTISTVKYYMFSETSKKNRRAELFKSV